jgi:hypothetical protein
LAEAYAQINNSSAEQRDADDERAAALIEKMAERVEAIAAALEGA